MDNIGILKIILGNDGIGINIAILVYLFMRLEKLSNKLSELSGKVEVILDEIFKNNED